MEEYEDALDEYEKGRAEYEDGLAQYEDGVKELESGEKELAAGRSKLESGQQQLNSLAKTVTDALAGTGSPYAGAPGKLLDDLGRGDSAAIATTDSALNNMRAQLDRRYCEGAGARLTRCRHQLLVHSQCSNRPDSREGFHPRSAMTPEQEQMLAEAQAAKPQLEAGIADRTGAEGADGASSLPSCKASARAASPQTSGNWTTDGASITAARPSSTRAEKSCLTPKSS